MCNLKISWLCLFVIYFELRIVRLGLSSIRTVNMGLNEFKEFSIGESECLIMKIPQVYQTSVLNIESKNVGKLVLTDRMIFGENMTSASCHIEAKVCSEYINASSINYVNSVCSLNFYVIACMEQNEVEEPISISLETRFSKSQGCNPIHPGENESCFQFGENCSDPSKCSTICQTLICSKASKTQSFCVPRSETYLNYRTICSIAYNSNQNGISYSLKDCEPNSSNRLSNPNLQVTVFYKSIAVVFGLIVLAIIVSSFYYRLKLKENGFAPFRAPNIIPEFIFPNPRKESLLITN